MKTSRVKVPLAPPPGVILSTGAVSDPAKVGDKNIAPNTTEADDKIAEGQRQISRIWEITQSCLAILVTATTLYISGVLALTRGTGEGPAFLLLSNMFVLVISTYISRTNHTKVGGVPKGYDGR